MWVPILFSCNFIHLGLKLDWAIQNEGCRSKNRSEKLKWIWKNDSETRFFLDLQTCFCTNFTEIDAAPKRIKLQRSAWWQIEAFKVLSNSYKKIHLLGKDNIINHWRKVLLFFESRSKSLSSELKSEQANEQMNAVERVSEPIQSWLSLYLRWKEELYQKS